MKQGSIRVADTPLFLRIRGSELLREALADGQKIFPAAGRSRRTRLEEMRSAVHGDEPPPCG